MDDVVLQVPYKASNYKYKIGKLKDFLASKIKNKADSISRVRWAGVVTEYATKNLTQRAVFFSHLGNSTLGPNAKTPDMTTGGQF